MGLYKVFSREQISEIVSKYIDEFGVNGLSKDEAEITKSFFTDLFWYFNDTARLTTATSCWRGGCKL